ncbi:hypothetical protein AGMMS50262_04710 [Bacteroidia bacterium]|nr:hypothetical protein AGMMS50262_04710 [Bacteroidia bacterium]
MKNYLVLLLLTVSLSVVAQTHDPTVVRMVNLGKMCVAPRADYPAKAALFVPDGILADSLSSIVQDGITAMGGNFYQNAQTNVFKVGADGFTVNTGIVRFMQASDPAVQRAVALWPSGRTIPARYTSANPSATGFFVRGDHYIAFPNILLTTADTIHVGAVLGMDAINLTRPADSTGVLYLESNAVGADQVFDASLRVTGNSVSAGMVVIEKYVQPFRNTNNGNHYLYPFASPYTGQRAGYYAGNWVRAPQADASGSYGYPYGNKKAATGNWIDASQFVHGAGDLLTAGAPYLLELMPQGFDYDSDPYVMTGGEDHDLQTFVFDGTPYNLPYNAEQKFTGELFSRSAKAGTDAGNKTQNWVIGNSYTSALSIDSLVEAIVDSKITFSKVFYVYPHGATSYLTCNTDNVSALPDIPAMSVFMLIVSSTNTETAEVFKIRPGMQTHGKGIKTDRSGADKSPALPPAALTFHLTPENNPFIYDRAQVVLQAGASEGSDSGDVSKLLNTGHYFNLYSQAGNSKLQTNSLPETTGQTSLCVTAPKFAVSCRLTVEGVETVHAPSLQLYDTKLNVWTDLYENSEYVFTSEPGDSPDRFKLYFKAPTEIETVNTESIYAYCQDNTLYVNRLTDADKGAKLLIYNASGFILQQTEIDTYPHYSTAVSLPQGVYIAKIEGNRNTVVKFIK